jgi:hypothetical protein
MLSLIFYLSSIILVESDDVSIRDSIFPIREHYFIIPVRREGTCETCTLVIAATTNSEARTHFRDQNLQLLQQMQEPRNSYSIQ